MALVTKTWTQVIPLHTITFTLTGDSTPIVISDTADNLEATEIYNAYQKRRNFGATITIKATQTVPERTISLACICGMSKEKVGQFTHGYNQLLDCTPCTWCL